MNQAMGQTIDMDKLKVKVNPAHTAVLVIDMQKDYCCDGGTFDRRGFDVKPAQRMAVRLKDFLDKARAARTRIVHLKMTKIASLVSPHRRSFTNGSVLNESPTLRMPSSMK